MISYSASFTWRGLIRSFDTSGEDVLTLESASCILYLLIGACIGKSSAPPIQQEKYHILLLSLTVINPIPCRLPIMPHPDQLQEPITLKIPSLAHQPPKLMKRPQL
jgi:hypothetical protein